jgi:hypothetical protein
MKTTTVLFTLFFAFAFRGYSQFNESFEGGIPATWTVLNGGDSNTWESSPNGNAHTGASVAKITYSFDAHDDYLITPQFTVTAGVSNRLSFWARNLTDSYPEPFDILLSATGNAAANFTTAIATVSPPDDGWVRYEYNLNAFIGQTVYIAFHSTTTNMDEVYLDDVIVDAVPTLPPGCIVNPVSTINTACGNFATTIAWDALAEANGYLLTIGTTPGGTDIVNNQDLGTETSYVLEEQSLNTTYYWKVIPYNLVGPAIGCTENNYTTHTVGCYCTPNPQNVDGIGITNVLMEGLDNTTVDEAGNYGDYTAMSATVYQGLQAPFAITYETGYTYETKIWVDWNNDYDFNDAGEEVFNGISESDNPTTLSGAFMVPASATLGNHRMRIGGQDSGPVTVCYDGFYGSFEDYTLNVSVANCSAPVATTAVTFDCANNQFFVQVNVTDLGSGTPAITDGTTTWPVTAVGNVQVGPFPFAAPVSLALQHGSNAVCNIPLGTLNYDGCPPTNDNCSNAIPLTPGSAYTSNVTDGTNVFATASPAPAILCNGSAGGDIWFSVVVPASGNLTIETGNTADGQETTFDSVIAIYSGTCGALTYVDCDDDSADTGSYSKKALTGLTPGATLYISVFEYMNDTEGTFGIAAHDPSLSAPSFDVFGLSVYPNPVKDILNLSYTSDISAVTIVNLLGQEILKKRIHAPQYQLGLSDLANGTYLAKIEVGDLVKTIKIIKSN